MTGEEPINDTLIMILYLKNIENHRQDSVTFLQMECKLL